MYATYNSKNFKTKQNKNIKVWLWPPLALPWWYPWTRHGPTALCIFKTVVNFYILSHVMRTLQRPSTLHGHYPV